MIRIAIAYACGSLGGFITALLIWLLGALNVTSAAGVAIAPPLSPDWLYSRAVWGGLWGFIFLPPFLAHRTWWTRALVFSLGPTLVTWLVVLPFKAGAGLFGLDLGILAPVFVLAFNAVWGLATAYAIALTYRDRVQRTAAKPFAR
jgi:hypothetical protein